MSQGGPVAIEYTRRNPDRVTKLILVGTYALGRRRRAATETAMQEYDVQRDMISLGWGRDDHAYRLFFASTFIADGAPELWADFAELLRRTTSAENALRIYDACAEIDVIDAAAQIDVPTLIMHGADDRRVPFDQARRLADLISSSRLVRLDSSNHLLREDEPAWGQLLFELNDFLRDA